MDKFKVNNGTIYECPFCGLASVGILYVDLLGMNLAQALEIFNNPENTKHMEYISGSENISYEGFTFLIGVEWAYNDSNVVRVSLRRPYEGETIR